MVAKKLSIYCSILSKGKEIKKRVVFSLEKVTHEVEIADIVVDVVIAANFVSVKYEGEHIASRVELEKVQLALL
ncbi:hypothetical protein COA05_05990 [Bacillus thuringiensis]|nr:hypothetical protein DN403_29010 [Bacillus sp. AY2-1]PGQ42031.1 hypothetical protein COA05_05990 [Bacillus thuringiensis]